jgi:potassium-transporting ATPase KdpC subunit
MADSDNPALVPVDWVAAPRSKLDSHISAEATLYQVHRVAQARSLSDEAINTLVNQYAEGRQFGFLGEPRVNVLELDLALDGLK